MIKFAARAGMTIRVSTGLEDLGAPDRMSTTSFFYAMPGDRLHLLDVRYLFNVATYSPEVNEKFIYTYSYQPDQNWTKYNGDLSEDSFRHDDYIFSQPCYFRLCFKRVDGADFSDSDADVVNEIISFVQEAQVTPAADVKPFIAEECTKLLYRIEKNRTEDSLLFALLADTHFTINGTWDDTLASLKAVHEKEKFDGIIHLGDFTDGLVTAAATKQYADCVINDLNSMGVPLFITIGNHDANYFKNNPEPFSLGEQCRLYLSHSDSYTVREPDSPWYYKDFHEHGMRFVFLHSFDHTRMHRYVYTTNCLRWLERTLADTPDGYDILIFNHLAPLVRLQYWATRIYGCKKLVDILEGVNAGSQEGKILAFINGHNHTDLIYNGLSFPVVSIGCSKTEYFTNYKPRGAYTPKRRLGETTQELWDAFIVTPKERRLDFLRFGAGDDRVINENMCYCLPREG